MSTRSCRRDGRNGKPILLHPVQQRAPRKSEKFRGVRAIAAVALERKPDQRPFDGDEVDSGVRNGERDARISRILRSSNRNRCMLVAGGCGTHDGKRGKRGAGGARRPGARFAPVLGRLGEDRRASRCLFSYSVGPAV